MSKDSEEKNIVEKVIDGAEEAAENIHQMIPDIDFGEIAATEPVKTLANGAEEAAENIHRMIPDIDVTGTEPVKTLWDGAEGAAETLGEMIPDILKSNDEE